MDNPRSSENVLNIPVDKLSINKMTSHGIQVVHFVQKFLKDKLSS